METIVLKRMLKLDVVVRFSDIVIDLKARRFSMLLGIKESGKRKFIEEEVSGYVTADLLNWLTKASVVKVQIEDGSYMSTGEFKTGYQKYLDKIGKPFTKLVDMEFIASNKSDDYYSCPFKLIRYCNGNNTLTNVNSTSRKPVVTVDPNTNVETKEFVKRYAKLGDNYVPTFHSKKDYVRLAVQEEYTVQTKSE